MGGTRSGARRLITGTRLTVFCPTLHGTLHALQKQVGCFNHRVVALVADKLERQWSLEVCFDVED